MTLDPKLKPYDVYPLAIRAEIDAAEIYRKLLDGVKNEILKQKLVFLAGEEDRHKAILERVFHDHFPERKLVVPAASARPKKKIDLADSAAVLDLFRLAMQKEKEAEEFYRSGKAGAEDAQSKRIFEYLARVERSHYHILRAEIDILEKFPDYYNAEAEYFGQDLFHVGT